MSDFSLRREIMARELHESGDIVGAIEMREAGDYPRPPKGTVPDPTLDDDGVGDDLTDFEEDDE